MYRSIVAVVATLACAGASAETLIRRDAMGRRTGAVEVERDGSAVRRDALGRRAGTVERSGDRLIERDAQGRRTGTIDLPSQRRR